MQKLAGWVAVFLMVYRNNASRLGSGFISVCLETRWLGHLGGFYVPERVCSPQTATVKKLTLKKDFDRKKNPPPPGGFPIYYVL